MTTAMPISFKRAALPLAAVLASSLLCAAGASVASAAVDLQISSASNSTVAPGDNDPNTAELRYHLEARNESGEFADGTVDPLVIDATLPPGITFVKITTPFEPWECPTASVGDSSFTCTNNASSIVLYASHTPTIEASVAPSAAGVLTASFELSGGTAPVSDSTVDPIRIASEQLSPGFDAFDVALSANPAGDTYTKAAGHPDSFKTSIDFNTHTDPDPFYGDTAPIEFTRDVVVDLPPGLIGNPAAAGVCTLIQLSNSAGFEPRPFCPVDSQIGTTVIRNNSGGGLPMTLRYPVFNVAAPPGVPARLGFNAFGTPVVLDAVLRSDGDYGLSAVAANIPQGLTLTGTDVNLWGNPADESHRPERACPGSAPPSYGGPTCPGSATSVPFLRMPTSCTAAGEGLEWRAQMDSWENPGALGANGRPAAADPRWPSASVVSHEAPGYPFSPDDPSTPWGETRGVTDCPDVPVNGKLAAAPTSIDTQTSSGLTVHLEVPNPGLENPVGIASSDLKKVKVTLPEGLTVNPSQAEGLGTCSPSRYASTRLEFHPDGLHGCPSDSKIGSVEVKTPLLEERIPGSVYVAKPFENPFGTLLALYVVLEEPQRGILVKVAGKVETDGKAGQITATFDDLPQVPFSTFDFKFREGARAPLVTPAACGTYETIAEITGHSDPANPITSVSDFQIVRGIGGGPCPTGGLPPFKPGLIAGSINNAAGKYSPFNVRLFRTDAEQEFTNFSIKLPPGISGKLAGVPFCPDAAIEAAKSRTGEQEIASPSCPKASEVGHTLAGAGVGSALVYAPGKIYLAGPYNGSALSIVSATAAKVGPFDLGTVVVRLALRVDPETAEVFVDATGSDPIPHIIDGITVHLRDIRAYVDKPEFALNPTSCARTSTSSTLLGSGLDFSSAIDDRPVTVSTPYQAADCAALAFKPDLKLSLKGGTKRAGHPALKAVLKMKPGMANISRIEATLPKSEFLDQSHIGTVCTRVQYAKDQCPAKSIYGYARAFTPILDEPLQGPVYLRSSEHKLPDLVAGLKSGKIEIDVVGRIDSVDGRIRSTFETVPDAPLSKAVLMMQGGKKGLLENSTNLCAKAHRATVEFDAHNGKFSDVNPALKPQCSKAKKKAARQKRAAR